MKKERTIRILIFILITLLGSPLLSPIKRAIAEIDGFPDGLVLMIFDGNQGNASGVLIGDKVVTSAHVIEADPKRFFVTQKGKLVEITAFISDRKVIHSSYMSPEAGLNIETQRPVPRTTMENFEEYIRAKSDVGFMELTTGSGFNTDFQLMAGDDLGGFLEAVSNADTIQGLVQSRFRNQRGILDSVTGDFQLLSQTVLQFSDEPSIQSVFGQEVLIHRSPTIGRHRVISTGQDFLLEMSYDFNEYWGQDRLDGDLISINESFEENSNRGDSGGPISLRSATNQRLRMVAGLTSAHVHAGNDGIFSEPSIVYTPSWLINRFLSDPTLQKEVNYSSSSTSCWKVLIR